MNLNSDILPAPSKIGPIGAEHQEADPSTSMTSMTSQQESEEQRNEDQPDLVLNLNCSTRDQLITSLNQLSVILQSNKPVPAEEKQKIRKKIDAAMQLLMDLSPFGPPQSANPSGLFGEMVFGQLIVELSRAERSKIINHLIAVRDAVLFDSLIADETKPNLFATNKRIINQLLDLPVKDQTDESDEDGNESIAELLLKQQKAESAATNEELNWKAIAQSQREQIFGLEAKMDELKQKIEKVDISPGFGAIAASNPFGKTQQTERVNLWLSGDVVTQPQSSTFIFNDPFARLPDNFSTMATVSNVVGTTIKFDPHVSTDIMFKNGSNHPVTVRHQCITCMRQYENKSLEELRYEDYKKKKSSYRFL